MALFKVFRGNEADLIKVPLTEGYGYFIPNSFDYDTEDGESHLGGKLFFDVKNNNDGTLERFQVDAQVAKGLLVDGVFLSGDELAKTSELEDVLRSEEHLTGIILGNGTRNLIAKEISENQILIGDGENGLKGVGVANNSLLLGSTNTGIKDVAIPDKEFIIGDKDDGIKTIDAQEARTELSVYSKEETNTKIGVATTVALEATLLASVWEQKADGTYEYTISTNRIRCGANHNVPPLITLISSNVSDYAMIESAVANVGENIIFTASSRPESDISIIIIDNA